MPLDDDTDDKPQFSAEELSEIEDDTEGDGDDKGADEGADEGTEDKGQDDKDEGDKPAGKDGKPATAKKSSGTRKTLATGADPDEDDEGEAKTDEAKAAARAEEIKALRERLAKHYSAGDKKAYQKELARLERLGIEKPEQIYGLYREAEKKLTSGGLVKVPGEDAKPEEVEALRKALGVPEKPEGYLQDIKLSNGAVIGDADKPMIMGYLESVHKATTPKEIISATLKWYYDSQEKAAAELDEADEAFRRESAEILKEEYGPAYKRMMGALRSAFGTAPGGSDINNENSVISRLLGGRTADGKIIGNDPEITRWLVSLGQEINPAAAVVEDGVQSGMSLDAEIEKIEKVMRENRREYNSKYADRYRQLLEAREKIQARQSAA